MEVFSVHRELVDSGAQRPLCATASWSESTALNSDTAVALQFWKWYLHDNRSLIFIASWAPHADLGVAMFIDHWSALGSELDKKVGQVIHVSMDANAVVPYREEPGRYIGRWVAGIVGERAEYLSHWALERRVRLVNTQLQKRNVATHVLPQGEARTIDHIGVASRHLQVHDSGAIDIDSFPTDHLCVFAGVPLKTRQRARRGRGGGGKHSTTARRS